MSTNAETGRIEREAAASPDPGLDDERTVLRISRASLRSQPPAVRFVGREASSGRPPQDWK